MKKLFFPFLLGLLSLAVVFGTALALRGPAATQAQADGVPLCVTAFLDYHAVTSGIVIFFCVITMIHAAAPNRWRGLYVTQLSLGVVMLLILCFFSYAANQWVKKEPHRESPRRTASD